MFEKILNLAAMSSSLASAGMVHRFLSTMMNNLIAGMFCVFSLCVFLVSLLITTYYLLLYYGVDALVAGLCLGLFACVLSSAAAFLSVYHILKLRQMGHAYMGDTDTVGTNLKAMLLAFLNGYIRPKS